MIFKQYRYEPLAQASYLLGCVRAKEAVVVDPIADMRRPGPERVRRVGPAPRREAGVPRVRRDGGLAGAGLSGGEDGQGVRSRSPNESVGLAGPGKDA